MQASSLGLDIFSPHSPLGIVIIIIGVSFSILIGYVFYLCITDKPSSYTLKIEKIKKDKQLKNIGRLYPKQEIDLD